LRGVHAAASAWPSFLKTEMVPMFNMGYLPPMTTGFAQFLAAPPILQQVTKGLEKRIREERTQPFNSQPPLRERVAAAERLSIPSPPRETEPALVLLDNLGNEEVRFLKAMHPELMEKALKPVKWEERGPVVLIPTWAKSVATYGKMLEGMTVGNLVESLGKVPQIAPQIHDPKGMLLTPEQRIERARSLLAMGFALALIRGGAKLCSSPGEFHFELGDEQLNPFELVTKLSDGAISRAAWEEKCRKLGIENLPLGLENKADATVQ
jgi:heat shock protein HtpX